MNITAKELSGNHIGKKIKLGAIYATIKEIKAGTRTVEVRAGVAPSSIGPEVHFLSIPIDSTVTIQGDEPAGPIGVNGTAAIANRFGISSDFIATLPKSQLTEDRLIEFPKATRIELIRNGKREVVSYGASGVKAYLQDDGRTLKLHYNKDEREGL